MARPFALDATLRSGESLAVSSAAILDDLSARGLVHDSTDLDLLRARLEEGPLVVYAGFDPTGDSLHVGHLVPLLLLRRFQVFGHRPIALAGGATGMIGDPGGRSSERNLLDRATLDANAGAISAQLSRFLDFEADGNPARLVDNRDWTADLGVLDFLRDVGKHVTVNTMLAKESVRARVQSEHGISFTEFSYMLLQANDFRHLHDELGVELQVGGSDQWGNITAGIDLIRRTSGHHVHGLTVPLVTRSDGHKFGKSTGDAVWLDPQRTSPYAFFQYFVNTDDRDVERFLLQLTLLGLDEIESIVGRHRRAPEQRLAQRALAEAVTRLVHGEAAATEAAGAVDGLHPLGGRALRGRVGGPGRDRAHRGPRRRRGADPAVDPGGDLIALLVAPGILASKSEGRRLVAQGGLYVNDVAVVEGRRLGDDDWYHGRYCMVRRGKKQRHLLVR